MLQLDTTTPLCEDALADAAGRVQVPTYDRSQLSCSVVHIGVGCFHRAHQAVYFDEIAQRGISSEWGITGFGLRNPEFKRALDAQDTLYTVVKRSAESDRGRVVGSIRRTVFVPEEPVAALAALTAAETKLVTLTITGDGYVRPVSGRSAPGTVFELIGAALAARRREGTAPFTVLSCDNLADNGDAARRATLAASGDSELARWIESHVAFPKSVVDRITPATTDDTRALVARRFGIDDRWPVVCEPFAHWVIEDDFCNERPPLDLVGAQFVSDVDTYGRAKRRMLNGGHSALGYVGYLLGHRTTDGAMADPMVVEFIRKLLDDEVIPLLLRPAGLDLADYRRQLLERFANPRLADPLQRLCGRGSTKVPEYLLPSLVEARASGRPFELLALALAAWLRYLRGFDIDGERIAIRDERLETLRPLARAGGSDPRPLLSVRSVFGDLVEDEFAVATIERALRAIDADGLERTVARYLDARDPVAA
ncbi:MAG TPA: mannitol dehydrogenase family protein [Solirubrobacterales bacterium]|nr:mannitol dehydrogenase family protein [Solirubrobacterales bacterium]